MGEEDTVHGPSVKDTRERAASPIELQDLAKKLAALARQIKTIAATPLSEGGDLDDSGQTSTSAARLNQPRSM
ncbi:hypothetical protein ASD02_16350 [Ensifer sp. Root1252]|nr:hypothetical protein ASD02_16350 [Ensifer sp. Root1252]KRC57129.1 hypothetical protein ASE32_19665 [Ensifer sp. Root231]KRC87624.1 hypothetical protein ASE47_13820 [Ensifer sp. Root258]